MIVALGHVSIEESHTHHQVTLLKKVEIPNILGHKEPLSETKTPVETEDGQYRRLSSPVCLSYVFILLDILIV